MSRIPALHVVAAALLFVALTGCSAAPVQSESTGSGPVQQPCDAAFVRATMTGVERSSDLQLLDNELVPGRMLTDDGQSLQPEFSPDGSRIAFVSGRGYSASSEHGNELQSVYVMDADGRNERRLTTDHDDTEPTWSPDGSRIAFVRSLPSSTDQQLVVVAVDSGEDTVVVTGSIWWEVAWLSDDELAYTEWGSGPTFDVRRVGREGGPSQVLVADLPFEGPVWSPDRSKFAFSAAYPEQGVRVADVASGEVSAVPESDTQVAVALIWTADDYLLFSQNTTGPTFDIAASRGGSEQPVVLSSGWQKLYDAPQSDNPLCERQA